VIAVPRLLRSGHWQTIEWPEAAKDPLGDGHLEGVARKSGADKIGPSEVCRPHVDQTIGPVLVFEVTDGNRIGGGWMHAFSDHKGEDEGDDDSEAHWRHPMRP
jgi:hypothetical protein